MTCREALPIIVEYQQRFLVEPQPKWPHWYTEKRVNGIYAIEVLKRQCKLSLDENIDDVLYKLICTFFQLELEFDYSNKDLVHIYEQCQEELETFQKFIFNKEKIINEFSEYCKECRQLDYKA